MLIFGVCFSLYFSLITRQAKVLSSISSICGFAKIATIIITLFFTLNKGLVKRLFKFYKKLERESIKLYSHQKVNLVVISKATKISEFKKKILHFIIMKK